MKVTLPKGKAFRRRTQGLDDMEVPPSGTSVWSIANLVPVRGDTFVKSGTQLGTLFQVKKRVCCSYQVGI